MKRIYLEGKTIMGIKGPRAKLPFVISLTSRRAARFICMSAIKEKWGTTTLVLYPRVKIGQFVLCAFQPERGYFVTYIDTTPNRD